MYVLGIDTATMVCSVGLAGQDRIIAEVTVHTRQTHSERLMPMIRQMIADADLTPQDLSGIAVSIGPGSFTGLRIGITTAKSMAFALDIPVAGISTLEALAAQFPYCGYLIRPVIDAQKENVYTALYCTDAGYPQRLGDIEVMSMRSVAQHIQTCGQRVIVTGEIVPFGEQLATLDDGALVYPAQALYRMPRGAVIAELGLRRLLAGQGEDPGSLTPFYLRRPEAEVLWEKRHGGGDGNGDHI